MKKVLIAVLIILQTACASTQNIKGENEKPPESIFIQDKEIFLSELTKEIKYLRDPTLFTLQVYAQYNAYAEVCENYNEDDLLEINKNNEKIDELFNDSYRLKENPEREAFFQIVINYLEQHYKYEATDEICDLKRTELQKERV